MSLLRALKKSGSKIRQKSGETKAALTPAADLLIETNKGLIPPTDRLKPRMLQFRVGDFALLCFAD
jgi:hypothetical protein